MSENSSFEKVLETIVRESEKSLEKSYQAVLIEFNQTLEFFKNVPEQNITEIEKITKQNQEKTLEAIKEAELKNLQRWKAIVQEIEMQREAIMQADSKKLDVLIASIDEKECQKQEELLEVINQLRVFL